MHIYLKTGEGFLRAFVGGVSKALMCCVRFQRFSFPVSDQVDTM